MASMGSVVTDATDRLFMFDPNMFRLLYEVIKLDL
jgi:hypothetical protein